MSDPQLFEPPEPTPVTERRLAPLASPAELSKRLRVIAAGMRAAADSGLARPVLVGDLADLDDAAEVLDRIELEGLPNG